MVFDPDYFRIGKAMTAAGLLLILVIFLFEYKNGRIIKRLISSSFKKVEDIPAPAADAVSVTENEDTSDTAAAETPENAGDTGDKDVN